MHTLLLTEQETKARFIKTALRCENLESDLMYLKTPKEKLEQAIIQANGLFIHVEKNTLMIEDLVDFCLTIKRNLPIILLSSDFQVSLFELLYSEGKIKNFFVRPFPFRLIATEMRSIIFLEREIIQKNKLQVRKLELNRETHEIKLEGKPIYLRHKEYALLEFLMLNEGKVLSRGTILENVWDRNADIFTNTVDVHINQLRKKLNVSDKFIRTIPCSGYIMT